MNPIYISIIIVLVGAIVVYARFVRREELRHLSEERDSEARHATDWKELAKVLADGALAMREVPTQEEARAHAEMLRKERDEEDREPTLEELEEEMKDMQNPLSVSFEGEAGRRRELALKIHRLKGSRGFAEPQEELTEEVTNVLDSSDMAHLSGRAH